MAKEILVRNSTAEFLTFVAEGKEDGVQVLFKDETIWASQKAMATLFDCSTDNIGLHLKNIFKSGELDENAVTEKFSATAADVVAGNVSAEFARKFAEAEFEKYRIAQDRLFKSDFDRLNDSDLLDFDNNS